MVSSDRHSPFFTPNAIIEGIRGSSKMLMFRPEFRNSVTLLFLARTDILLPYRYLNYRNAVESSSTIIKMAVPRLDFRCASGIQERCCSRVRYDRLCFGRSPRKARTEIEMGTDLVFESIKVFGLSEP